MDDEQLLINYLHNALDSDQRARVEQLLRVDDHARQRLGRLRRQQRLLRDGLAAELRSVEPPPTLTFAAIQPRLARRRGRPSRLYSVAAALALVVLTLALLFSLPQSIDDGREVAPVVVTIVETFGPLQATPILSATQPMYNSPSIVTRTPTPFVDESGDQFSTVPTRTAP